MRAYMEFDVIERPFLTGLNWLDGGDDRRGQSVEDSRKTGGGFENWQMISGLPDGFNMLRC
jgi:hypothetical protein